MNNFLKSIRNLLIRIELEPETGKKVKKFFMNFEMIVFTGATLGLWVVVIELAGRSL